MAKMLLFPWFLFRLGLAITPTVIASAWIPMRRWENAVFSLVAVLLVCLISLQLYPTPVVISNPVINSIAGTHPTKQAELEKQLNIHLELYRLQPTSRDVLINLALLYRALYQPEVGDRYWERAQKIDPNNGLFN